MRATPLRAVSSRMMTGATAALLLTLAVGARPYVPASARRAHVCEPVVADVEARWQSAGAWRTLAPYPLPREATPTDSIGVWIERWTLPTGDVELHRVSAEATLVARMAPSDCRETITTYRRSYDTLALRGAFTDAALRSLVARNARGAVYVWSPRMPLSVSGKETARRAAVALGLAFTAVEVNTMESLELVYRNGTVHYPTLLLYRNGAMLDGAIPGFKSEGAYASLIASRLREPANNRAHKPSATVPTLWVDRRARITTVSSVPTVRDIGFFFKPVAGTTLVTYTADERAYLFDRSTGMERRIPGHVDPVPTPDGLFLTRPGLIVYPMDAVRTGDTTALFIDEELPDEYQTASVIAKSRGGMRYRMITGWRENARFRDYDVTLPDAKQGGARRATIRAVAPAFVPCAGRTLSLPISAKSGREFGAFDVLRETNGILEVTPDGGCVDRLDLGFASGKLAFSYDGKSIAFSTSRINIDTAGTLRKPSEMFYQDALLMERATGRLVPLSRNRLAHIMSFPEFMANGSIMVLDQSQPGALRELRVK